MGRPRRLRGPWIVVLASLEVSCGLLLDLEPPTGKPLPKSAATTPTVGSGPGALPDGGSARVTALWTGWAQMCASLDNGALECWGTNTSGQLGTGDTQDHPQPAAVKIVEGAKITQVSLGLEHSCAIDTSQSSGALYCWGKNSDGQLGLEDTNPRLTPDRTSLNDVLAVQCGETHSCAMTSRQQVFCWGSNEWGTLGLGRPIGAGQSATRPEWISSLRATKLADGYGRHACVVADAEGETGRIYCWGYNSFGELGDGTRDNKNAPVRAGNITGAVDVRLGLGNTCAIFADKSVQCWGEGSRGQFADGTRTNRLFPGPGPMGLPTPIEQLSLGFSHACATDANGAVQCWGENIRAQVGLDSGLSPDGSIADQLRPGPLVIPPIKVGSLSGRAFSSCALGADGQVFCWGANGAGQLLTGDAIDRFAPTPITP